MEHSPMFDFIKQMYEQGMAPKEWVYSYVPLFITAEEYEEITGEAYE